MSDALNSRRQRVPAPLRERKKRFRIALAMAGLTAGAWAEKANVDPTFLSRVLAGKGTSQPLLDRIDAFIAKHLRDVAA